MKRWAGILLAAALSIACCACSMQKPELSVAPSSFSRETTEVLRPFQSELQFVDLKLNEDAKQWKISLWSYRDGEWKCQGSVVDEIKPGAQSLRFAVRLTTEECTFYTMDGTGPSSISFEKIDSDFETSGFGDWSENRRRRRLLSEKRSPSGQNWVWTGSRSKRGI